MTNHTDKTAKVKKIAFGFSKEKWLAVAVGLLVVLVGTLTIGPFISDRMLQSVDTTKYQVVYLANGQVYFCKLQNTRGDYLVIRGAYTCLLYTSRCV